MRYAWLAALLAGCGVAVPAATRPPGCGGPASPSRLGAIDFLSPRLGVGLTTPSARCRPMLAVTHDGGSHWLTAGSPLPGGGSNVEHVVATSTTDVWAAAGSDPLMATTDGGANWAAETPPGRVVALALTGRTVWMLACLGGSRYSCVSVLLRMVLPRGAWTISSPKLASTTPPELAFAGRRRVVISAAGSLVIVSDRGQRSVTLSDPTWMGRPCQAAAFAAAGPNWWLLCLGGAAAGSSEKALLDTTDGGRIWTTASQVTSLTTPAHPGEITLEEPTSLAAGSPRRLWLAALNNLYTSDDGGSQWNQVPGPDPQGSPASFDVLSPTHAWLLAAGEGLWRTTDGRHWRAL